MASALAKSNGEADLAALCEDAPDEDLLEQFLSGEEFESQEAFRVLVVRHGPMVLGTCRHLLDRPEDAEDAFQATFLVLARKGGSIRNRKLLAAWLHEVAHRIAVKARANGVRLRNLERQGVAMVPPAIGPNDPHQAAAWNELRGVLHAEVERLPERYRIPVILSYLEGKTNEEVAQLLQWPVGTVKGRLSRAREMLRSRLLRRGLCLSAAFLVTALSHGVVFAEAVPSDLVKRTVRLARRFGPHASPPIGDSPPGSGPSTEPDMHALAQSLADARRRKRGFTSRALGLFCLLLLCLSMSVGIGWAVAGGAQSVSIRGILSALIPARLSGPGSPGPCH
jgi:RNA polymerase sigma factor (sigma-70 family)